MFPFSFVLLFNLFITLLLFQSLDDPGLLPSVAGDASLPMPGFRGAARAGVWHPNIRWVVPQLVPQGVGGCRATRAGSRSPPCTWREGTGWLPADNIVPF